MTEYEHENTYYGIKLKGSVCEFLELFTDFHWILKSQNTGFLGVKLEETHTQETLEKVLFPKMIEDYKLILSKSRLKNKEKALKVLQEYVEVDTTKTPIIIKKEGSNNKYYKSFEEMESIAESVKLKMK